MIGICISKKISEKQSTLLKNYCSTVWECSNCGAQYDRDYNAVENIMLKGVEKYLEYELGYGC